jgi:hypothetical protein
MSEVLLLNCENNVKLSWSTVCGVQGVLLKGVPAFRMYRRSQQQMILACLNVGLCAVEQTS